MTSDWIDAPYVGCDRCERETRVEVPIRAGLEVPCEHCKAIIRVVNTRDVRQSRAAVVKMPPGAAFEDEETPVQSPQECPSCGAKGIVFNVVDGQPRCPRCPKEAA